MISQLVFHSDCTCPEIFDPLITEYEAKSVVSLTLIDTLLTGCLKKNAMEIQ